MFQGFPVSRDSGTIFFTSRLSSSATGFSDGFPRCTLASKSFAISRLESGRNKGLSLKAFFAALVFCFLAKPLRLRIIMNAVPAANSSYAPFGSVMLNQLPELSFMIASIP